MNTKMKSKFTIIYTKENNWIVARCVEVDVVSQGRTMKSAEKNIKEAVTLYLESFGSAGIAPIASKPVVKSIALPNYVKTVIGVRKRANQVSRKAGIQSNSAKRKSRIPAKSGA
jgi:predicted RNase H-like HicB family nuclease